MDEGRLGAESAIAIIADLAAQGHLILGIDGFRIVPTGHMASLDLILDLSFQPRAVEEAARLATAFVTEHAAPDVLFEVVSDKD